MKKQKGRRRRAWTGPTPKQPIETLRLCMGCRKPMWLSKEGFRCLGCKFVYCKTCARRHFKITPKHRTKIRKLRSKWAAGLRRKSKAALAAIAAKIEWGRAKRGKLAHAWRWRGRGAPCMRRVVCNPKLRRPRLGALNRRGDRRCMKCRTLVRKKGA